MLQIACVADCTCCKGAKFGLFLWGEALYWRKSVKLYVTPSQGVYDGSDGCIVDTVIEDATNIRTLLLVFKAVDIVTSGLQKQLKTLEYIFRSGMWDHVINMYVTWLQGFANRNHKCICLFPVGETNNRVEWRQEYHLMVSWRYFVFRKLWHIDSQVLPSIIKVFFSLQLVHGSSR